LLTSLSSKLLLGNNNLHGGNIIGVGDWVVEDADGSDRLASGSGFLLVSHVRGIANHEGRLRHLVARLDTNDFAVLDHDLVDGCVEHVGTAVDCAQTGEGFGQATETVHGVQEGGSTVFAHGVGIQFHLWHGLHSNLR